MKKSQSYRKDFFWTIGLGFILILLILILGVSFFKALNNTQINSRKEFLRKQTELAAIDLEIEISRFMDYANSLSDYLEDSDLDEEDYNDDFTKSTKRVFINYFGLIDTVLVDFKDSVIFMTQTPRNDFIRGVYKSDVEAFRNSEYQYELQGKTLGFRMIFKLNPVAFAKDFVKNYYLNPDGKKSLFLNGKFQDINPGDGFSDLEIDSESYQKLMDDIEIGILGVYEVGWTYEDLDHEGILVQYPFRFGDISPASSLLFMIESEPITEGVYRTYFLLFLGLVFLLVGIIVLFTFFLRNRIKSERLLRKRSKEISELFDQQNLLLKELRGFVFFHDSKGQIIRVSDEVGEVLGVSKDRFISAFNDKKDQKDAGRIRDLVKKALHDKASYIDFEYDYVNRNGKVIYLRIFEKLIFDNDGKFTGGIGICTDITRNHISRQELVQSEKRLRTLIENIPDFIFIYDNQGIIIDYQVQLIDNLVKPGFNLLGKKFTELIPKNQIEHIKSAFKIARKTGILQSVDLRTRVNSEEKYYEIKIFPLDENKMMSISRDITSQRIWEQGLLDAMNSADQANRAKSDFLANMSHEIRTPMNGLLGIIDLLEQTKMDDTQNEYLKIIKNSGNSLLNIIRDILDYSKIESGKIEIHNSVFIPKDELEKQVQILSGLAQKKKIEVVLSFSEGTDIVLEGDIEKIKQVFLNILGNALKFTPGQGKVIISVSTEEVSEDLVFLNVSIKDTGIGIPKDLIPHLTDPFFQVDSSKTRSFQGTGLGLAISKRIVELLGGELKIVSEDQIGSEFIFNVLLKISTNSVTDHSSTFDQNRKSWIGMAGEYPLRILLAEDNDLNLQLMNLMLEQLGYNFDIAKNGKEAVDLVNTNDYDLILMDVQMPILNGLEASKLIKSMPYSHHPYIIGLSANVFDEDRKMAFESGMDDYLTKPIRLLSLAEKLKLFSIRIQRDEK
ncbi:PAS domain-containing hybrid sensor histidine kinase/response regulator [Algoriphagus marinus]|uniref:PAS domain-containing hybrid sensor histidine kinase/response regulator n=1 Tax=Algoriphagus marinus TaxID=1925762 RepID=UPI00094B7E5B|nr:PAS domain-containing hybrid sensor histidine kinase/response regulator [Algoriphagus marinus]